MTKAEETNVYSPQTYSFLFINLLSLFNLQRLSKMGRGDFTKSKSKTELQCTGVCIQVTTIILGFFVFDVVLYFWSLEVGLLTDLLFLCILFYVYIKDSLTKSSCFIHFKINLYLDCPTVQECPLRDELSYYIR